MNKKKITTAVFPVAGLGTRFFPITKTGPKEMLPIVDKPIIQYVVQEAIEAGITHLVFVTSSDKRAIEDYFDRNLQLEMWLEQQGKWKDLQIIRNIIPSHISISYVRQPIPLGLGHAILCSRHVVGDQPFAVLLPDDIIDCHDTNCLQKMIEIYQNKKASIIAVEQVCPQEVSNYGIVTLKAQDPHYQIIDMIEKPSFESAPSLLAVIGRYILSPNIFSLLQNTTFDVSREIQLTDALVAMMKQEKVFAFPIQGRRFDCGNKLSMMKAMLFFALKRNAMRKSLLEFFSECLKFYESHEEVQLKTEV